MKQIGVAIILGTVVAMVLPSLAQTTQPANLPLDYRANDAYTQGRYTVALPLLQELAGTLIDEPDKLGPVEERIRVCKKAIAAAQTMTADPMATPPMSAETRIPHPAPVAGQMLEMPIKQLGNFEYDADHGGNIPKDVWRLSGCKLCTRGYMIPLDQAEDISEFALVPSLFACCFGQPPQIQHTIVVHLPPGKAVSYFPDELQVEGTLTVDERKDEGYIVSIFDLDATSVKPAPK
ncbi:MAG TPA: DUF3299 domain-containing protein [Tepidisphaeraceae bacterium]|nr:DUF3299 domain-containing protein [Tepidisphaeraceae bacterium]